MTKNTAPQFTLVAADKVPARAVSATAKERLAEFQAKQKAEREAAAAPIVTGLIAGQAVTDGVTYKTYADANKAAQTVLRLVKPGLAAQTFRPSVRVSGSGEAFTFHVLAVAVPAEAEAPAEAPAS